VRVLLLALFMLVPASAACCAATLTVKVENLDPKGGILSLSLYDEASWSREPDAPVTSANVPAVSPETTITFEGVKPGIYGVKTFQDVNRNGKFDQNWIGLPLEHYGFSRDARPLFSAPGFNRTEFTVVEGANEITIHLQ
jgi:uncharacterized protein (DUF2141 family)